MRPVFTALSVASAAVILMAGCGSAHTSSTKTATAGSAVDGTVGEEIKTHVEALNHGTAGIQSVTCAERGPVPSMGTDAVAFLCSIRADNGEVTKPELWASLPMDEENKVELLDLTAERELAARGDIAGLNDGRSEPANKAAEEDIKHAEASVRESLNKQARPNVPSPTTATAGSPEATPSATVPSTTGSGENASARPCGSVSSGEYTEIPVVSYGGTRCSTARNLVALVMAQGSHHYRALPDDGYEIHGWVCYVSTGLASCTLPGTGKRVNGAYSESGRSIAK